MTEDFIEQYFEGAAIKVKAIGHTVQIPAFYRIKNKYDLAEFDTAIRNIKGSACLGLEMGDGQFGAFDSPRDDARIGIHVILKSPSAKFEDIKATRDRAKSILIMIIALMRRDCEDLGLYADDQAGPLNAINLFFNSEVKYGDIDVPMTNWYGKCMYFDWKAPVDLSYDANNYNN